ncbi:hypothetical protein L873DRAFT_1841139 [Choiromyces venosus 120613-1]|uniref:Uncharacterized protein n=1 Tax=Choiromyces venosus 120613-1 TaxID=1336337 RepID=A0A3N4JZ10_9PEZI|nr:hypothetical protein L873DRAFT_1841139 [Choiromyces venosus 120613-1]
MNPPPLPTYTVADRIYSVYFQKSLEAISTAEAAVTSSLHPPSAILLSQAVSPSLNDVRVSPTPDGTTPSAKQISPTSTSVITSSEKPKVPSLAIAGMAAGGAIAICIALVAIFTVLQRRRCIGRVRQGSIASTGRAPSAPDDCATATTTEARECERPPSLRIPSDGTTTSKKSLARVTWKDQVCPDESFMTYHSHSPSSETSHSAGGEYRHPFMHPGVPTTYRSFSSPVLGAHIPPSASMCNSTIAPARGCIFPAHVHSDSQFPHSHSHSHYLASSGQQEQTILCTSVYSFLPGGGRRSLSDSFMTPGLCAPNPVRKSSILQSGFVQAYSPSLFHPAYKSEFSKRSEHGCAGGNEAGGDSSSAFVVMSGGGGHSGSISSVSSTGSSILNYTVGNTPQKLFRGGKKAAGEAGVLDIDDSSPPSSLESPPTGGLTSPHSRRGGEVPFARSLFQAGTSLLSSEGAHIDEDLAATATRGNIGLALSPSLSNSIFDDTALSDKASTGDVFLDLPSLDSVVSAQDPMSTRHFSCSLPTRPRLLSLESPPPLRENLEGGSSPDADAFFSTASSSPISPPNGYPPTPDPSSELEFGPLGALPVKSSRRMLGGVESAYSPTLSMVNYYSSIAGNPADTRFSSVNLCSTFSFPSPPGPKVFTFSPVGSPMSRFESASVDMGGSVRGSLVMDYSPRTRPISVGLESITTVGEGSLELQGGLGIMGGRCRKRRRYSGRFFTNGEGVLMIDDGGVEEDCLDGGVSLNEGRGEKAGSMV